MVKLKYLSVLAALPVLFLTGCSYMHYDRKAYDYKKHAKTAEPISKTLRMNKAEMKPYYVVPPIRKIKGAAVSQVPPDSRLDLINKHKLFEKPQLVEKPHVTPVEKVVRSSNDMIVINAELPVAWKKVGEAINRAGYQIMDKDTSIYAYYLLDTYSTDKKIDSKTPIYQLFLKKRGNETIAVLYDSHNKPAKSTVANRILSAVQTEIS